MSEHTRKEPVYPDYGRRNLDAFCPDQDKRRKGYEDHGLIPTNNLRIYIKDDPKPELAPGIPNIHDYRQRSFGFAIEELRTTHPELWERAKVAIAEAGRLMGRYGDLLHNGQKEEAAAIIELLDKAILADHEVCDEIFRIIAPQLEAAGLDPMEICI